MSDLPQNEQLPPHQGLERKEAVYPNGVGCLMELLAITTTYRHEIINFLEDPTTTDAHILEILLAADEYSRQEPDTSPNSSVPHIVKTFSISRELSQLWSDATQYLDQPQELEAQIHTLKQKIDFTDQEGINSLDWVLTRLDFAHPKATNIDTTLSSYVANCLTEIQHGNPEVDTKALRHITGAPIHDIISPTLVNVSGVISLVFPEDMDPNSDDNSKMLNALRDAYGSGSVDKYNRGTRALIENLQTTNIPYDGSTIEACVTQGIEQAHAHFYDQELLPNVEIHLDQFPSNGLERVFWIVPNPSAVPSIVENMVDNAAKYGTAPDANGNNPRVKINVSTGINQMSKAFEVVITDNGRGFSQEMLDLIQQAGGLHKLPDDALKKLLESPQKPDTDETDNGQAQTGTNSEAPAVPSKRTGMIAYAKQIDSAGGSLEIGNNETGGSWVKISFAHYPYHNFIEGVLKSPLPNS